MVFILRKLTVFFTAFFFVFSSIALSSERAMGTMREGEKKIFLINKLLEKAKKGDTQSQLRLAEQLASFSLPEYDHMAFRWVDIAAHSGDVDAQYLLGVFYLEGIGVEIDYLKAYQLFYSLSKKNNVLAQCKLAQMYYEGTGGIRDKKLGRKWIMEAAESGLPQADFLIKKWVKDDIVLTEEDFATTEGEEYLNAWMVYATKYESPYAYYYYGVVNFYGWGDKDQDIQEGIKYLKKAAQLKYFPAVQELNKIYAYEGFMYYDGDKATKNGLDNELTETQAY